jgi:hypothetical protein
VTLCCHWSMATASWDLYTKSSAHHSYAGAPACCRSEGKHLYGL